MSASPTPSTLAAHGIVADGQTCCHAGLSAAIAERMATHPAGATLHLPDGVYGIRHTLVLPQGLSLSMDPGARLLALPGFDGEAIVETAQFEGREYAVQCIRGGVIDGGCQPLIGVRTVWDRETDLRDITIQNCLRKGLHLGVRGNCETNLFNVRVQVESGVTAEPGSIGIHYDKTTDNLVCGVIVIGYEIGMRSDSSSNDFQQIHVWNYRDGAPLKVCFEANGWNDTYNQCYADSPMDGDAECYGFRVTRPFQRFSNCRVYNNKWTTRDRVVGFQIEPGGTHGTYMGNHFTADGDHAIRAAYAGTLEAATMLGCTYAASVLAGRVNQLPSDTGGLSHLPTVSLAGGRLNLPPRTTPPTADEGAPGDLCWVDGDAPALYLRTATAWRKTAL